MGGLTCLTCQVGFSDPELHRNHFKGNQLGYISKALNNLTPKGIC